MRAEFVHIAGDAVIEAGTDGKEDIGMVHRHVRFVSAVHPQHPQELRVVTGITAKPHQRPRHGQVQAARHINQFRVGIVENDAAAEVQHWPLRFFQRFQGALDLPDVPFHRRLIRAQRDFIGVVEIGKSTGHVFGDINQHRTRSAAARDMEGLFDGQCQLGYVLHQKAVLDAGAGDADRIHFLKSIVTNQYRRHLPGNDDQRNGIGVGGGDAGHGIGQPWPGGDNRHANFAGRARVTIRLVHRALLVAGEDVGDVLLLVNRVIDMQHRAARITEDVRNLLLAQCLNDDVCTADVMFFLRHSCFFSLRAGNSTHHIAGRQAAFCRFRRAASGRMMADGGRNDDIHRIKRDDIARQAVHHSDIHHKWRKNPSA